MVTMETIWKQAENLKEELVARRRNLHSHPETGWTEFRTASLIIKELEALGYEVHFGAEVVAEASMMGRPTAAELERYMKRAVTEGADLALVEKMAGGKTGVVGILDTGRPGKTVAFRFGLQRCGRRQRRRTSPGGRRFLFYPYKSHACLRA